MRCWTAWRLRLLGRRRDMFLVPDRFVRVPPARIGRMARGPFFVHLGRRLPPVLPGDWDLAGSPNDHDGLYDDLRAVAAGAVWESTEVYRRSVGHIRAGVPGFDGVTNMEELASFCARYEDLLASMREGGYLSQTRLASLRPQSYKPLDPREVTVAVGREGSLLVRQGRHRVACATVLEVPEIPARVAFRHPDWMAVRQRVADYAAGNGGRVPQPILHPDLDNIPAARACDVEFERLKDVLRLQGGSLVDLSPRWGYFCHRFEGVGLTCTAVCSRPEDEWFLRTLREAEQRVFDIVAIDAIDVRRPFDAALALDWMEGVPDRAAAAEELLELVGRVDAATLIVEVPHVVAGASDWEPGGPGDGLADALTHAGGFSTRSLVLWTDSRREVYRLARGRGS